MTFSQVRKCKAELQLTDQHYECGIFLLAQYLVQKDDQGIYCFPAMWIGRTINNQQFWVHCFLPYQEQDDSFVSLTYFHSQHSKHRHRKSNSLGIKRWNKSLHRDYYSPHIYSGTESESSSDPTGRLSLCHLQWCRHQFWIVLLSITTGISKAKINQIYKSDHILQVKAPVKPNVLRNAFLFFFSLVVKKKLIVYLIFKTNTTAIYSNITKPEKEKQNLMELLK